MPPGDTTIHIPGQTGPPAPVGDPYTDSLVGSVWQGDPLTAEEERPQFIFPQWEIFLFVLLLAFVTVYFYIVRPASARKRKIREIRRDDSAANAIREIQYDSWLRKYNPYYNTLQDELRKRFLQRTIEFMLSKEFRFHSLQPEEHIPVLISGAAVQLTFGLKRFLIEYFQVINVIKSDYSIMGRDKVLEGHVQVDNQSINISWNSFIEDYKDYTDSENVGLHEIAHAVSFDFLYGYQENRNAVFTERFRGYIQEARGVFKDLCQGRNDLLDEYGTHNVEEFWAVCVETFFENAEEFKRKMPGLYRSVAEILNQDPLEPGKILDKELAGLANS